MPWRSSRSCGFLLSTGLWLVAGYALAQAPGGAAFPADPTAPTPPPAPSPSEAPVAPAATPAPAPAPAPAPGVAEPAPVTQPYPQENAPPPGYGASYGEPPPPPAPPADEPTPIPPFSIRIDPLNAILLGHLGFELEVGIAKWISIETVPMFVTDTSPPWLGFGGGDDRVYQHSNGVGPLAGATIGVNFWPGGKVFRGYVLRTGFTNYGLEYETRANDTQVDSVAHTERRFYVMLGSVERWGPVALGFGFGLGYDLNNQTRCFPKGATNRAQAQPGSCDEIQIATAAPVNAGPIAVISPFAYPWDILGRISLGVVID